ncbi:MAG TPA: TonB-dependent receptor plug domain-containing protein [Gemmatimonadales bacterium]|nr:TonB-dependent receptor plug domain-containing protein [Gemmatimonadales bacterium]
MDYTARYLQAVELEEVRVPVMPDLSAPGPRPALTRIVFTRDSIEWMNGATVGDLLSQVPGVYLWRGGFTGRPELVDLQGRGASSAEYYLDGMPYVAAGVDSLAVDPSLFSISFLDRVEVERWPGLIRVYLFTRRHDRVAPRSRVAIARGDRDFARYEADLERRFPVGVGFALAADYLDSPTASGTASNYSNTQVWGQGSYVPSHRFGIQYQLVHARPKRQPFTIAGVTPSDTIGMGYTATRTDAQFRAALRSRDDGMGAGLDVIYARSAWDGAGVDQQINQIGGMVSYRAPAYSLSASGFHRTRWTPLDLRATLGLAPVGPLAASAEGVLQHHFGGRTSRYVSLAAGLEPARGIALTAMARLGDMVAAPSIASDTAQKLRDFSAQVGWHRARVGLQLAYQRTSAFSPFAYADYLQIPSLAPSSDVDWITVSARVAPVQWITLESWYSDPTKGTVDGVPPTHSLTTATIRSKFWRSFPSGTFDLKAQLSMEAWGRGTIGRDALGNPINLRGATFFSTQLAIQLQSFMIYWNRDNISASKLTYVPGFRLPNYGSNFGVRWEFLN